MIQAVAIKVHHIVTCSANPMNTQYCVAICLYATRPVRLQAADKE